MFRAIPVGSKIIHKKELKEEQMKHEKKLQEIKKSKSEYFRINRPVTISKNNRFWRDRDNEIKLKNKLLAEKIDEIENPETHFVLNVVSDHQTARKTFYVNGKAPMKRTSSSDMRNTSISQGFELKRKQKVLKETIENVNMLNRIKKAPAHYRLADMRNHTLSHKQFLQMHCEYPLILEKPLPKPASAILNESALPNTKQNSQESIMLLDKSKNPTDVRPSTQQKSPSKQPAESKGKEKHTEQQSAIHIVKTEQNHKKKQDMNPAAPVSRTGSNERMQPKKEPKFTDNLLLMGRHFLKKDLIIIYENVISYKKKLYHCTATKEKE